MTTASILAILAGLFLTAPGLLVLLVALAVAFVAGIAYTRRELRNNPEKFLANVAKAKGLRDDVRAKWDSIATLVKNELG